MTRRHPLVPSIVAAGLVGLLLSPSTMAGESASSKTGSAAPATKDGSDNIPLPATNVGFYAKHSDWKGRGLFLAADEEGADAPASSVFQFAPDATMRVRVAVANYGSSIVSNIPVSIVLQNDLDDVVATYQFAVFGEGIEPECYSVSDFLPMATSSTRLSGNYTLTVTLDPDNTLGDNDLEDNKETVRIAILPETPIEVKTALGNPDLDFTVQSDDGNDPFGQDFDDGDPAVQFGPQGHGTTSSLATTVEGPGTISFDWATECEGHDGLQFLVDGKSEKSLVGGNTDWVHVSVKIGEGFHNLVWAYGKDDADDGSLDAAFLSSVKWDSTLTAPDVPKDVKASDGKYTSKIRISWKAAARASSYIVYRASSSSGTKKEIWRGTALKYDDKDSSLVTDTKYYYWVKAANTVGTSGYSANGEYGWKKLATYTVKFDSNGGTGKMSNLSAGVGKAVSLTKNAYTRKGCVFAGWATAKAGVGKGAVAFKNGASVTDLAASGKSVTLYAVWAKKTYKVKFYRNGGKGKMAVQKFTYGKAKKLSANKFKRPGYKFKGWATSKSKAKKGQVAYKNRKKVKNLLMNGKTVKLYAVWKKRR